MERLHHTRRFIQRDRLNSLQRRLVRGLALCLPLLCVSTVRAQALSWPASIQAAPAVSLQGGADAADLRGTACWGASSCVSVGEDDVSGAEEAIVLPEIDGSLGQTVAVALPPSAQLGSGERASLNSVSCTSTGACVAVGEYRDTSGVTDGLVVPISAGTTGTGVEVTSSQASGELYLRSVSCPSSGTCAAVGSAGVDANNYQAGVVVPINGGVPGAASLVPLPSDANTTSPEVSINAVDCWSGASCVAAGQYQSETGQGGVDPLIVPISNGAPATGIQVALPSNAFGNTSGQQSQLVSVSCQSTGACVAAGTYVDSNGGSRPLVVPITGGEPALVVLLSLPGNAGGPTSDAGLDAVGCASSGPCSAVGYYADTEGSQEPLVVSVTKGLVGAGIEATLPAGALGLSTGDQDATLTAVTCPGSGSCLAVGDFDDSSDAQQGLIEPVAGGQPQAANESGIPSGVTSDPYATFAAVACAGSGSCFAAGELDAPSGQAQPYAYSLQTPLAVGSRLPAARVRNAYAEALATTGAWNTYSWSLASGRLPAGLRLNAQTGLISGIPRKFGTYRFTVEAHGSGDPAQTATQALALRVAKEPRIVLDPSIARTGLTLSGRFVSFKISCLVVACHGTAKLVYEHEVTLKGHKRMRLSTVIGSGGYSLRAGRSRSVRIRLTAAGLRLLRRATDHRLAVRLTAAVTGGKTKSARTTLIGTIT